MNAWPRLVPGAVVTRTRWGAYLAQTPPSHRFRLAVIRTTAPLAVVALSEAIEAWGRLAARREGE